MSEPLRDLYYVKKTLVNLAVDRGGQKALAADLGVSQAYLNDILRERRMPGKKILDALGLERVDMYRNKVTP